MLIAGATIAFITIAFIDSSYGAQSAGQAEAAAIGGIQDAQLRLIRGDLAGGGTYTVATATGAATVTVAPPSAGLAAVLSVGTVRFRTRKIQAVFAIDPVTGQVAMVSWSEIQ